METSSGKENWKKTLTKAEVVPSDAVWEGIELYLDKTEVVRLRRSVLMYKWVAAACVTLTIVAFASIYTVQKGIVVTTDKGKLSDLSWKEQGQRMQEQPGEEKNIDQPEPQLLASATYATSVAEKITSNKNTSTNTSSGISNSFLSFNSWKLSPVISSWGSGASSDQVLLARESDSQLLQSPLLQQTEEGEMLAFLQMDKTREDLAPDKGGERFWTSVGFSAGTFNNVTPTNGSAPASALRSFTAGQTAASESNSPGYSYAVNLAVGAKISKRWLLQGGMSYIAQLSDYTATSVVTNQNADNTQTISAASINQFEKKSDETHPELTILASTPYSVNNEIQLISFPVQAGYILVDRKVALQVNTGFSTDLFMQNTITPQVENLEKTTQGRGDDSPYRPVNFSGLVGTEVSYRFAENYRIALSPGLRYPINSIYKSDLGVKSSPLTFDVALRFRYILK